MFHNFCHSRNQILANNQVINLKKIYPNSIFSGYIVHLTKSVKRISEGVRKSKLAFLKAIEDAEKANTREERSEILDKLETFIRWEEVIKSSFSI